MAPEKLIFDTKGDVLLVFTRRSKEDKDLGKDSPSELSSLKRKAPEDISKTVTMLVSSKHMALASPVFDAMLSGGRFKEGTELLIKGKVEIELPDDDPVAFAIVANVIHHRNKMVPVKLHHLQILQVAIITEKYQMYEAVRWVSNKWLHEFYSNLDQGFVSETDPCAAIFISLVFGHIDSFSLFTDVAILTCNEKFEAPIKDHYYLPTSLIDAIRAARIQAFSDVFAALNSFLERQTEVASYCDDTLDVCGIMTTDSFLKSMAINHCWPFPPPPYARITLTRLFANISQIDIRTSCQGDIAPGEGCINRQIFKKMIGVQIKEIFARNFLGLDIKKFQRSSQRMNT